MTIGRLAEQAKLIMESNRNIQKNGISEDDVVRFLRIAESEVHKKTASNVSPEIIIDTIKTGSLKIVKDRNFALSYQKAIDMNPCNPSIEDMLKVKELVPDRGWKSVFISSGLFGGNIDEAIEFARSVDWWLYKTLERVEMFRKISGCGGGQ